MDRTASSAFRPGASDGRTVAQRALDPRSRCEHTPDPGPHDPGTIATRVGAIKNPDDRRFATLPTERDKPRPAAQPRTSDTVKLEPGLTLGKYRVVQPLGAGGMGTVYQAEHVEISKPVALKVLSSALAADPKAQARFLREAESASRLEHRHVVSVTDFGTETGVAYIVMELLRGEDLAAHLNRHPRGLPVEDAIGLMLAVCSGVSAAHAAGIIHRDLKPRNIFLAQTPLREVEAKVLDFGISKVDTGVDASLTGTGEVLGTTHYMSPEQILGREIDPRTDQYSLGVVLYECLTARRPYEGDTALAIMKSIGDGKCVPPSALRQDLPRELDGVVLRAMAREPAGRFESVDAFGAALLPFASRKHRVVWADYYGADVRDSSIAGSARAPASSSAAPAMVRNLRSAEAAMPKTTRLPTDERSASREFDDAGGGGEGSGSGSHYEDLVATRRPWRWLAIVASAVIGFVVVAFIVSGRSPRAPRAPRRVEVPSTATADSPSPRGVLSPPPPTAVPEAPQQDATEGSSQAPRQPRADERSPTAKPAKKIHKPVRATTRSRERVDYTNDGSPILK